MPTSSSAQTLIKEALCDLGTIRPGETPSSTILDDCLVRLNQRVASYSTEQLIPQTMINTTFALQVGVSRYTLGSGGVFNAAARAMKVTAWKASYSTLTSGGAPLSFAAFEEAANRIQVDFTKNNAEVQGIEDSLTSQVTALQNTLSAEIAKLQAAMVGAATSAQAEAAAKIRGIAAPFFLAPSFTFPSPTFTAPSYTAMTLPSLALASAAVPMILAADTAYPLINIGVFPAPSAIGSLELSYWTPLTEFASLAGTLTLPEGWEDFLHFDLAMALIPRYGRQGFDPTTLAANAQNAKAKLVDLNRMQALETK
jgi:hypothetical protein